MRIESYVFSMELPFLVPSISFSRSIFLHEVFSILPEGFLLTFLAVQVCDKYFRLFLHMKKYLCFTFMFGTYFCCVQNYRVTDPFSLCYKEAVHRLLASFVSDVESAFIFTFFSFLFLRITPFLGALKLLSLFLALTNLATVF